MWSREEGPRGSRAGLGDQSELRKPNHRFAGTNWERPDVQAETNGLPIYGSVVLLSGATDAVADGAPAPALSGLGPAHSSCPLVPERHEGGTSGNGAAFTPWIPLCRIRPVCG